MEKSKKHIGPLLRDINHRDLAAEEELQDSIFDEMDKLQALCNAQAIIDSTNDMSFSFIKNRAHYSVLIEEQATKMRTLLDRYFS